MNFNNLERKTKAELFELIQSKQVEIDALKDKINKVLYAISQSELHGDRAIWGIQDEIKELLK